MTRMQEMVIDQAIACDTAPVKAKKARRPPSLTPGLYVPLVQGSQTSTMIMKPESPLAPHTPEEDFAKVPASRRSCPPVLGAQNETTVSYFMRENASQSRSFRKATGVLRNGEIVYMGEKFNSTKEFVEKIRTMERDLEGQDINVSSCNDMESPFQVSPRSGAMVDAMIASLHHSGIMTPPPSTPRQPASWPSA